MASVAPAACSFWAMPHAMERLLASPKTTAVLPAKSIMLILFLDGPRDVRRSCGQPLEYQPEFGRDGPGDPALAPGVQPPKIDQLDLARPAGPESASRGARIFPRNRWRNSGSRSKNPVGGLFRAGQPAVILAPVSRPASGSCVPRRLPPIRPSRSLHPRRNGAFNQRSQKRVMGAAKHQRVGIHARLRLASLKSSSR